MAVLEYMFHGSWRTTSKVLSTAFKPIGMSTVHGLAKKLSEIKLVEGRRGRLKLAVDEVKLKVEGREAYVCAAVDIDAKELLTTDASYQRSGLNAYLYPSQNAGEVQ